MAARPWKPAAFPRIAPSHQKILDRALARLGTAERVIRLWVPSLGETRVACLGVGRAMPSPAVGHLSWRIAALDGQGWLTLDSLSCLSLVSATLGLEAPRVERPPTRLEAGIVAATLAAVLRAASAPVTLDLDDHGRIDRDLVTLELEIACQAFRERVRAHVPPQWIPRSTLAEIAGEAIRRRLSVSLSLEAARTVLAMGDWSRAELGDAIVFDGCAAPPAAGTGPFRLLVRCGASSAEATCLEGDQVRLDSELVPDPPRADHSAAPLGRAATMTSAKEGSHEMEAGDDARMARLAMLASAPVELVAEVGQVVLRADEVIALQPGSVLSLARPRERLVELKIGDRVWARGELVDVDGELAVRLTELAGEPRGHGGDPSATVVPLADG